MTTTDTSTTPVEVDDVTRGFADDLGRVADAIRTGAIPRPRNGVRVYLTSYFLDPGAGKAVFLASRREFPDAQVEVTENYVEVIVGEGCRLLFDKSALGERTTVTREVDEYVIDPTLLLPVSA